MSQLTAIRLELLGMLFVPFISLAVIEACGFVLPVRNGRAKTTNSGEVEPILRAL